MTNYDISQDEQHVIEQALEAHRRKQKYQAAIDELTAELEIEFNKSDLGTPASQKRMADIRQQIKELQALT
jgi:hypothetical protein